MKNLKLIIFFNPERSILQGVIMYVFLYSNLIIVFLCYKLPEYNTQSIIEPFEWDLKMKIKLFNNNLYIFIKMY